MKNLFLICAVSLAAFSFKYAYDVRSNTAEVEQMDGLYIFVDSKPVKEYDYLGTEKVGVSMGSGQYRDVRDKLIKKIKKEYPQAQGILIHFAEGGADKADAIKFK